MMHICLFPVIFEKTECCILGAGIQGLGAYDACKVILSH